MTKTRKRLVWGVVCSGAAVFSAGMAISAFNPQPDPPGHYFGMLGIVAGQGVSLHVVNRRVRLDGYPPDPCRAELQLLDQFGDVLARQDERVMAGDAATLDFTLVDRVGRTEPARAGRQLLRGVVLFKGNAEHCLSSLEVTDESGKSSGFLSPGTIVGFNPQPDPPGVPTRK